MNDVKKYIQSLFENRKLTVTQNKAGLLEAFLADEATVAAVQQILENEELIMGRWKIKSRVDDVLRQHIAVPNGTVGKPYEAFVDVEKLQWKDIVINGVDGLEEIGLKYDAATNKIAGVPTVSGDLKFNIRFMVAGDQEATEYTRQVTIIINPDPRSLWKNVPAPADDKYSKEDAVSVFDTLGDKKIVAASVRGRSHANIGSFREDDMAYKHLDTGWNVVVVADGAGSAKLSRHGSAVACRSVIDFFTRNLSSAADAEFATAMKVHEQLPSAESKVIVDNWGTTLLQDAVKFTHEQLKDAADKAGADLKDLNTTLIFALFKRFDTGYVFFSFGVGDCPIALLNKDLTAVKMLNWLDVGEFGGGTRFITMPEIFTDEKYKTRFGCNIITDFSYLFLMSDGVYDAKFVVEANLEKMEKWSAFLADLGGDNEEHIKIDFVAADPGIADRLLSWMGFWSVGNHDDRTLAIVF